MFELSLHNQSDKLAKGTIVSSLLMTEQHKSVLPKIFDKDPVLKKKLEDYLAKIPPEKKKADYEKFQKFMNGELTWAEVKNYPKALFKYFAETGYLYYRYGNYKEAEIMFKGLSVMEHNNWYYRSMLGAIYQKQKLYEQAIDEYTVSLSLNETEIATLTNRGECYFLLGNFSLAKNDFETADKLNTDNKNPWGQRARLLLQKIKDKGGLLNQ